MKKRALISVSDKTGIVELAKEIVSLGYEIISTGGTAVALKNAGIPERDSDLIANFLDKTKLRAVKVKYKQRKEEGYLTENIDEEEVLQPILLGLHISTMYDLFCGENYVADSVREHFGKIDVGKMEEVRK